MFSPEQKTIIITSIITSIIATGTTLITLNNAEKNLEKQMLIHQENINKELENQKNLSIFQTKIDKKTEAFKKAMDVIDQVSSNNCYPIFKNNYVKAMSTSYDISDVRESLNDLLLYDENGLLIKYYLEALQIYNEEQIQDVIKHPEHSNVILNLTKFKIEARNQIGVSKLPIEIENSIVNKDATFIVAVGVANFDKYIESNICNIKNQK